MEKQTERTPEVAPDIVIINRNGSFSHDAETGITTISLDDGVRVAADAKADARLRLVLDNTTQVEDIDVVLFDKVGAISIRFPKTDDGRGFSLARRLRELGYRGEITAEGELHADQFRHALLSGFDRVAIPAARAQRIPERYWQEEAAAMLPSYQERFATTGG